MHTPNSKVYGYLGIEVQSFLKIACMIKKVNNACIMINSRFARHAQNKILTKTSNQIQLSDVKLVT